jgi:hypothetical protein
MFDNPTTNGRTYKLVRSNQWTSQEIKWVKKAFDGAHPDDDLCQKATTSYKFYFVPPDWDWRKAQDPPSACCLNKGPPASIDSTEDDWGWSVADYVFETWETSPGTYLNNVGFYTRITVGHPLFARHRYIWMELDGRATSNSAGSCVTNLCIIVYNAN